MNYDKKLILTGMITFILYNILDPPVIFSKDPAWVFMVDLVFNIYTIAFLWWTWNEIYPLPTTQNNPPELIIVSYNSFINEPDI